MRSNGKAVDGSGGKDLLRLLWDLPRNLHLIGYLQQLRIREYLPQQLPLFLRKFRFSYLAARATLNSYDVHLHQANYVQVVQVDYLDYDYEDYYRFGCVEKQLAR